ncbi:hypothetical protein B0H14DRAFT_3477078 [Mycena olivaceomarginata]|nr:hypothetical protein B0H14DRAFT_3477078 [Mycena olivaceomarginata]
MIQKQFRFQLTTPFCLAKATSTAGRPDNVGASAPATAAPSGTAAHNPAPTLIADAAAPATFAAIVAAPAPVATAHATLAAVVEVPAPNTTAQNITQHLANTAEAALVGPVWLTEDRNPPRGSYAPTPPGGFPTVVYSSALLTQGMSPGLMQLYNETHGLIRVAIGDFINVDPTSFHLGTPPTSKYSPSPVLWLVAGLSPPLAQAILDQPVLSSRPIILFTIPFDMPVIGFVGTFGGFTLPSTQGGADAACDLPPHKARLTC